MHRPRVCAVVRLWYAKRTHDLFAPLHGRHARVVAVSSGRPCNVAVMFNPSHAPDGSEPHVPVIVPVGNCKSQGYEPKGKR